MPIHHGIKQCSYVRHDGRRCGSPVCYGNRGQDRDRCYHHDRERYPDPLTITPQLREVADLFADPLFHEHLEQLSERLRNGEVVMDDLENTVSALIGFEIRSIRSAAEAERRLLGAEDSYASSQGTTSVVPQNIARSAFHGANEVRDPASAAPDFKNPRSSAFICG
jgi:hypothetical protein